MGRQTPSSNAWVAWQLLASLGLLLPAALHATPTVDVTYSEITAAAGVSNTWDGYGFGVGVAAEDLDNDGDPDLILPNSLGVPIRCFENIGDPDGKGHPTFREISGDLGLRDLGNSKAVLLADYDNDGLTDLFISNYDESRDSGRSGWPTYYSSICLHRNNGDGTFSDVTDEAGLVVTGLAAYGISAADIDSDGWIDLFVCNRGNVPSEVRLGGGYNLLFHNRGDGTFENISNSAGIADVRSLTFQSGFIDYDNDGDPDLYLANDKLDGNQLYRNDGNLTFTNVSTGSGADVRMNGMCVATGDFDGDLNLDIFVTNTPEGHALLRNNGNGTFSEMARSAGVSGGRIGWSSAWFDADNDALLDLYVVDYGPSNLNQLFINQGNSTFLDVSLTAGVQNPHDGYGLAVADFDLNGKLDFIVSNQDSPCGLFLNTSGPSSWVRFKLIGMQSNRDAIGARVYLYAGSKVQVREVVSGNAYLSHSEMEIHFGLGAAVPDSVQVRWPSGLRQTVAGLQRNSRHRIIEGIGLQTGTVLVDSTVQQTGQSVELRWETVQWPWDEGFRVKRSRVIDGVPQAEVVVADVSDQGRHHAFLDETAALSPGIYRYSVVLLQAGNRESTLFETRDLDIVPTPVTLLDFTASSTAAGVELSWRLSDESLTHMLGVRMQRASQKDGPYLDCGEMLKPSQVMHYEDTSELAHGIWWYRLLFLTAGGESHLSAPLAIEVRDGFSWPTALSAPVEPFADGPMRVRFSTGQAGPVSLRIFDLRGRLIRTLVHDRREAGEYSVSWNRRDNAGRELAHGVYFLQLRAGAGSDSRKLVLHRR